MTHEQFIKMITARRKSLGITQSELAKKAGIAQSTLSKIEKNSSTLSVKTLCKLLDCFGVELTFKWREP